MATFAVGWVVLYLGTVVTGSGPHSGDEDSRRTGLDPGTMSHVHAWAVYALVALTITTLVLARRDGNVPLRTAATALLATECVQARDRLHAVLPGPADRARAPAHARCRAHRGGPRVGRHLHAGHTGRPAEGVGSERRRRFSLPASPSRRRRWSAPTSRGCVVEEQSPTGDWGVASAEPVSWKLTPEKIEPGFPGTGHPFVERRDHIRYRRSGADRTGGFDGAVAPEIAPFRK